MIIVTSEDLTVPSRFTSPLKAKTSSVSSVTFRENQFSYCEVLHLSSVYSSPFFIATVTALSAETVNESHPMYLAVKSMLVCAAPFV